MHKVRIEGSSVFQNDKLVATVSSGWGMGVGTNRVFLIRSRKGNSEAKSFLKHMLSRMTVEELAAGVALSSPVDFGAYHGWVLPHFKIWVKKGLMTQAECDKHVANMSAAHAAALEG